MQFVTDENSTSRFLSLNNRGALVRSTVKVICMECRSATMLARLNDVKRC